MDFTEKCLEKNYIFKGKVVNLRKDTVLLPNNQEATREILEHNGGVCVLAINEYDEVLFVKQYRYAVQKTILEIPAGKLEKGEKPETCGKRELLEETGFIAKSFTYLTEFYPSVGYTSEKIYIYLAEKLSYKEAHLDPDEFLDVEKIPLQTALEMIKTGEIKDSKTIVALLHYANFTK